MSATDLFNAICADPEDDELRLQYADEVRAFDPDHAAFIRLQVGIAALRRRCVAASPDRRIWPWFPEEESQAGALLSKNRLRWIRDLIKFARSRRADLVEFDRGFPAQIEVEPHTFVTNADALFQIAPIRHINFTQPVDEHGHLRRQRDGSLPPFPIDELLARPHLARLDSIGFSHAAFVSSGPHTVGTAATIARCPHLTRCVYLAFVLTPIKESDLIELAEGPLTGKMLGISIRDVGECTSNENHTNGKEYLYTEFGEKWLDVERRVGYVPWLHRSHNGDSRLDARYHFDHTPGVPRYAPGTKPPERAWYEVPPLRCR